MDVTSTPHTFREGCLRAQSEARRHIERLKAITRGDPKAVLGLYDQATALLGDAAAQASVVRNAHPDPAMRDEAEKVEQDIEKQLTEMALDRDIYDVLAQLPAETFEPATRHWLTRTLRDFRRAGVDRDEATREKVRALSEELVRIGQEFGRNILTDVRHIAIESAELAGLPEDYRRAHSPGSDGKIRISTDSPDYLPFMTYARSGHAREALWRTYRLRGHPQNAPVLEKLVQKRHELATLLDYSSWAAYVTEDKMIRSETHAAAFIERITEASAQRCARDYQTLLERKRQDDPSAREVMPWDQAYLEDRIKAESYRSDSQAMRPYFEYGRVRDGVLGLTANLFGLRYQRIFDAPVWHADVEVYEVLQGDEKLGRFYLDMHPREGKYKHAAQFTLVTGKGGGPKPEGVLMCNFPRPGKEPALLQHRDVETFLHEFGHLLHHILGGHTLWAGLSGVRTEWDFVEAPSQMLEEWSWAPEALATFARHVETGAPLPAEDVKRLKAAEEFGKGLWVRQQMFYAALSLELYRKNPHGLDIEALARSLQEGYTPFKAVSGTYFHLSFGHLDGYSAIYYTYMWSLVIAKDLFAVFQAEGLMNPAPAQRYRRNILEPGGSKDAAALVHDFLGRDFTFDAYERWLNQA